MCTKHAVENSQLLICKKNSMFQLLTMQNKNNNCLLLIKWKIQKYLKFLLKLYMKHLLIVNGNTGKCNTGKWKLVRDFREVRVTDL